MPSVRSSTETAPANWSSGPGIAPVNWRGSLRMRRLVSTSSADTASQNSADLEGAAAGRASPSSGGIRLRAPRSPARDATFATADESGAARSAPAFGDQPSYPQRRACHGHVQPSGDRGPRHQFTGLVEQVVACSSSTSQSAPILDSPRAPQPLTRRSTPPGRRQVDADSAAIGPRAAHIRTRMSLPSVPSFAPGCGSGWDCLRCSWSRPRAVGDRRVPVPAVRLPYRSAMGLSLGRGRISAGDALPPVRSRDHANPVANKNFRDRAARHVRSDARNGRCRIGGRGRQ